MAKDNFLEAKNCQRCGRPFDHGGRIMSMFNTDCICIPCHEAERLRSDYGKALEAEREAVARGDFNFRGIGLSRQDGEDK